MIRTAILAGLLVVMLAIAYDKSVLTHLVTQPVASKPVEQTPVASVAQAERPMIPLQDRAPTVREKLLPEAKAVPPAPREEEPRHEPVAVETPAAAPPPVVVAAAPAVAAVAPTPVEEPSPAAPMLDKPMQLVPVDDLPLREVATPRVMIPKDLPLPSELGVAQAPPVTEASPAPARTPTPPPQFMSRTERTQELYRLAREMEDTFISKLAR